MDHDASRLKRIESIASSEPLGSLLYFAHVGLLLLGALIAFILFEQVVIGAIIGVYVSVLTFEKFISTRAVKLQRASWYPYVLLLLTLRAVIYNVLAIVVWSIDMEVFKLAAGALLVAATINIFVFHATFPEIIACVAVPIWLGFGAIATLLYVELGFGPQAIGAGLIFLFLTPYFYLALESARDQHNRFDQTKEALVVSNQHGALGQLALGVAHDFNNTIAISMGNAELLLEAKETEREALAYEIIKASERGATLARQLLAYGKRKDGKPEPHKIQAILSDLELVLARVLPPTIKVSVFAKPGCQDVICDRHKLETALLNLAINAKDAMLKGGELKIVAGPFSFPGPVDHPIDVELRAGGYIHVRVSDTGEGIHPNAHKKVFEPFYTTKQDRGGTGLGLSMVSDFVQQAGGAIAVESRIGRGTTVSLFLPVAEDQPGFPL